jgi:hypothetical protein
MPKRSPSFTSFRLVVDSLPRPRPATMRWDVSAPSPTMMEPINHLQVIQLENPSLYLWYLHTAKATSAYLVEEGRRQDEERIKAERRARRRQHEQGLRARFDWPDDKEPRPS